MNSTILVTCGGIAGDIRQQLGSRARMQKVEDGEPIGNYGDYIFDVSEADAARMNRKYPNKVTII